MIFTDLICSIKNLLQKSFRVCATSLIVVVYLVEHVVFDVVGACEGDS